MKVVIDLIEDIRNAIGDQKDFILGAVAVQKECDADGNSLLAWGKGISRAAVDEANECLNFYVEDGRPLTSGTVIDLLDSMPNDQMMYKVMVSRKGTPDLADAPLIGFTEDLNAKQYMLIIEET